MSECDHLFLAIDSKLPVQSIEHPVPCDFPLEYIPYTQRVVCNKCNQQFVIDNNGNILHDQEL